MTTPTHSGQRRLAAIVAIDMAGYSALAERDEVEAARRVAIMMDQLETLAGASGGRVFSTAGDGAMIEFASATNAVEAVIVFLQAIEGIRCGVHVGEVLHHRNGDLLGHGVNVAARLQQIAQTGGAMVSAQARAAVSRKIAQSLVSCGSMRLNKMQETIEVYSLARTIAGGAAIAELENKLPNASLDVQGAPALVRIPRGECLRAIEDLQGEGLPVKIAIAYDFAIGQFPVTVAEWRSAVEGGQLTDVADALDTSDEHPVVYVSWDDAVRYAKWLSRSTGRTFRLPSEMEWEYACRALSSAAFSTGDALDAQQACCRFEELERCDWPTGPAAVGSYPPNAFGAHDMHGNVWEWTADCWNPTLAHAPADGSPCLAGDCELRVIRGGSWAHSPQYARASARGHAEKNARNRFTGFRLVLEL